MRTVLDELGCSLQLLSGTTVNLGLDLSELNGNVGSVAIQHWGVTVADLAGVVHDDDLDTGERTSARQVKQEYK